MLNANVSSLSSPIANLSTNTPAKRGRKRTSDVEKAGYKERHITYDKRRNENPKEKRSF